MIIFEQYPLNGLETFEDELLFILADKIDFIVGMSDRSSINGNHIWGCIVQVSKNFSDFEGQEAVLKRICKIAGKYNRSFKGLFEIRVSMTISGRYKLNIRQNDSEPGDDQ